MAEKAPPKKKSTASSRQQMLEAYAETAKQVEERRETESKPEEKIEAKNLAAVIATADALSTEGVVKSISDLKSAVGKTLTQLSDKLEEEVGKYVQIQRAIVAKENELKEIYEIQKSASTLAALIETQQRKREEFEAEIEKDREELTREMETTRAEWEKEQKQREIEAKERDSAEAKRREREKEEYRYAFAREQQLAKDQFADETGKARKELAETKAQQDRELSAREKTLAAREEEFNSLRQRVEKIPAEIESAVARAVKETTARLQQESAAREELLKREFAGERNVLTTRITSLEQAVKEQSAQLVKLSTQAEKAYTQVQDIAVKAIEGSSNFKSLTSLQQLLSEQGRKTTPEK